VSDLTSTSPALSASSRSRQAFRRRSLPPHCADWPPLRLNAALVESSDVLFRYLTRLLLCFRPFPPTAALMPPGPADGSRDQRLLTPPSIRNALYLHGWYADSVSLAQRQLFKASLE
jgi:hypothetical protein